VIAIVLYLADQSKERRFRDVLVAPVKYLLFLLAWMTLSVSGALVASASFDLLFDNFIKTVLMCLVMAAAIRGIRDVERLAAAYLVAAAVYALVVITRFDLGAGDAWRLGHLYYYDANDFATFVVTALPLGLYFLHDGRRTVTRVLGGLALAILTVAFVRTGSRGGFLALLAVVTFVVVRYTGIALRWRVCATALIVVIVLGTASDQYWRQMSTIVSDTDYNHTEESGRMQIWRRGIGYMLDDPLFGVGPGNFQSAEGMLSPFAARQQFGIGVRWNAAHNTYIQAGAELGIPGLAMFIGMIASTFRSLSRAKRLAVPPDPAHLSLVHALMAALIGLVVGAFFLSFAYSELLYTLVAIAAGLEKITAAAGESVTA
jgi:O-antigen ligase